MGKSKTSKHVDIIMWYPELEGQTKFPHFIRNLKCANSDNEKMSTIDQVNVHDLSQTICLMGTIEQAEYRMTSF